MPSYRKEVALPGKSAQDLYDVLTKEMDSFLQSSSLTGYDLQRNPQSKSFDVKHAMFSATLSCLEGKMVLDGKLSLLATPFRSKIDEGIEQWLKKKFPTA